MRSHVQEKERDQEIAYRRGQVDGFVKEGRPIDGAVADECTESKTSKVGLYLKLRLFV